MKKINYQKVLNQLIKDYPHNIDKIEKVISDAKKNNSAAVVDFKTIINNNLWNVEEKARLLKKVEDYPDDNDFKYVLDIDSLVSFKALMEIIKKFKFNSINSKFEKYRCIFKAISEAKVAKYTYYKAVLNTLTPEEIKEFINKYWALSILTIFIDSGNIELVKEYISYVEDVNQFLAKVVETRNIQLVKIFINNGADLNYFDVEANDKRIWTPLKIAISNNDYEMVKFLIDSGADVNYKNSNAKDKKATSPLEFATKLRNTETQQEVSNFQYYVHFDESVSYRPNCTLITDSHIDHKTNSRTKIVNLIFDEINDKSKVNYNDLIIFSFITNDISSYTKFDHYAQNYQYKFDFHSLISAFIDFNAYRDPEMYTLFLSKVLTEHYLHDTNDNNFTFMLFKEYYKKEIEGKTIKNLNNNGFVKALLLSIPIEQIREFCLVPYCSDLDSLKYLLNKGFDINQVDKNGRTILHNLVLSSPLDGTMSEEQMELFGYLVKFSNLSLRDNDGKSVLYYACFKPLDKFLINKLIHNMKKETVYNEGIKSIVKYVQKTLRYPHQSHQVFPGIMELFNNILNKREYPRKSLAIETLDELYRSTEDYLFLVQKATLCINTLDIDESTINFEDLIDLCSFDTDIRCNRKYQAMNDDICFNTSEEYDYSQLIPQMILFYKKHINIIDFLENELKKDIKDEKYKTYIEDSYRIYKDLFNKYILLSILSIHPDKDNLEKLLNMVPKFDINSYLIDEDINYAYSDQQDMENDEAKNIHFTGGLMQYAILRDDLDMVMFLQKLGANIELVIDKNNCTWNYVNSDTMKNYIQGFVVPKHLQNLTKEEADYYYSLVEDGHQRQRKTINE